MTRALSPVVLLTLLFALAPFPSGYGDFGVTGAAWADDDDDGDGDDDDGRDDDDDDGPTRSSAAPPPAPAPPPPLAAPDEIVALDLTDADLLTLPAQGFETIEEVAVPGVATTARRLRIPPGSTLPAARDSVRALPSGQDADLNHFYRPEQGFPPDCRGAECLARHAIGWPRLPSRETACGRTVAIGMVDTGINDAHEAFEGARLEVIRLEPDGHDPSLAVHGTAVAALLVGDPSTRSPGLVPGSRLVAIDAFHRSGADERADAFALIKALGILVESEVRIVNLSLAGPENAALSAVLDRLAGERDMVIVSAAGNAGPRADPPFPASHEAVLGVTAVDRDGAVYRRAVRGPHIDLSAPGVEVWTAASISGARPKTGTSFAAPFVSAAAAILREQRPELASAEIAEELRRRARDLGDPGPDEVFGAGLLNLGSACDGAI